MGICDGVNWENVSHTDWDWVGLARILDFDSSSKLQKGELENYSKLMISLNTISRAKLEVSASIFY